MFALIASALLALTGNFGQCPPAQVLVGGKVQFDNATKAVVGFNSRNLGSFLVITNAPPLDYPTVEMYIEAEEAGCEVKMLTMGQTGIMGYELEYSDGNGYWQSFDKEGTTKINLANVGDRAYFRRSKIGGNATLSSVDVEAGHDIGSFSGNDRMHYFVISKRAKAGGNVGSLLYRRIPEMASVGGPGALFGLFYQCDKLTEANVSFLETTGVGCYMHMFDGCTSLKASPVLPAATTADYGYEKMFYGCTSLTNVGDIASTYYGSRACKEMFAGCTGLVNGPRALHVYDYMGAYSCQEMFAGCTSLKEAAIIPVEGTAWSYACYAMYSNCTSLVYAPDMHMSTVAPWTCAEMFKECHALTNCPSLPATTIADYCYYQMFWNCISLTKVPDVLPAMEMRERCYCQMFRYCSSMTIAPRLPAKSVTSFCYFRMFNGCTSLRACEVGYNNVPEDESNAVRYMLTSVDTTGVFVCPASYGNQATVPRGNYGPPSGWTVANPVDYIQGDGASWIDTGVVFGNENASTMDLRMEATYVVDTNLTSGSIIGVAQRDNAINALRFRLNRGTAYIQNFGVANTSIQAAHGETISAWYDKIAGGAPTGGFEGNPTYNFDPPSVQTYFTPPDYTAGMFCVTLTNKTQIQYSSHKVKWGYIKNRKTGQAFDGHPVCVDDGTTQTGYMYDRVSGTLKGNQGIGAFGIPYSTGSAVVNDSNKTYLETDFVLGGSRKMVMEAILLHRDTDNSTGDVTVGHSGTATEQQSDGYDYRLFRAGGNTMYCDIGAGRITFTPAVGQWHKVVMPVLFSGSNGTATVDGNNGSASSYVNLNDTGFRANGHNLRFFAFSLTSANGSRSQMVCIRRVKIYDYDTKEVLADFLPYTGGGFYDTISGKTYTPTAGAVSVVPWSSISTTEAFSE